MRMPRPPPPAAALIITGNPVFSTKAKAASADRPNLPATAGDGGHARGCRGLARCDLVAHVSRIDCAVGPTKISPAASTAAANSAFSARKAIARMHGVGARRLWPPRGSRRLVQDMILIVPAAGPISMRLVREPHGKRILVGLAVDLDGRDAEFARRTNDADGDLAAIGDEELLDRHGRANRLKRRSRRAADRPSLRPRSRQGNVQSCRSRPPSLR